MRKLHCESECTLPYTRYILSSCRYFHHSLAWNCTLKINNEEMRESKPNGIPWFGLEERRGFSLRVASSWESIFSWLPIVVLPVDMSSKHIPCAGNCCMYFRPTKRQFAEHEVCYSLNCKKTLSIPVHMPPHDMPAGEGWTACHWALPCHFPGLWSL